MISTRAKIELKEILCLCLPIIGAQVAQTMMGFVDTVMAGRVSALDLAAVAIGSSVWLPIYLTIAGLLQATTPIIAHHFGSKNSSGITHTFNQSLWLAVVAGIIGFFLLSNAEPLLMIMDINPELRGVSIQYLNAVAWGIPAISLFQVLRYLSEGIGHTRPIMLFSFLGLLINIPANYILIYGKFGAPALGGVGCGWATAIVMWIMLLSMLIYQWITPRYKELLTKHQWRLPQLQPLKELLLLGGPIGVAIFVEVSIFCVIALLIGSLGETIVAGHQIALNFAALVFMVPLSISQALTIRVGHALGAQRSTDAWYSATVGVKVALCFAVISASSILLGSTHIPYLYTNQTEVIAIASSLLVYAAIFQLSDAIQITSAGALRGYKDTTVPMLIILFVYWGVGLPLGYSLGLTNTWGTPMGPQGLWIGLVIGLTFAAITLGARLNWLRRRYAAA